MSDVIQDLIRSLPESQKTYERNHALLSQEVVGTFFLPYPFYVKESKGSRVTDVDGNSYIDLTMAFGPLILGHHPDVATEAIRRAADQSVLLGLPNPYQGDLAELLVAASPCAEQAFFCNSGTEATLYAIRAARAISGKSRIGLFQGSYHGAHDTVAFQANQKPDPKRPGVEPLGRGVSAGALAEVLALPYRDAAAFDLIEEHKQELAAVMIEPVQSSNPRSDVGPFLAELRQVCSRADVLLIFDEVITGFRLAYGGAQERFGVTPDLATYGKIIGGGLPVGAVAGAAKYMAAFNFFGGEASIFAGGTFCGNPLTMQAGTAVVRHLRDHPEIYTELTTKSQHLANEVNGFLQKEEYPAQLLHGDSLFHLVFTSDPVEHGLGFNPRTAELEHLYYAHVLQRGVVVPGLHIFFLSDAHSDADVDQVIDAFQDSFRALRAEGRI